MSRDTQLIAEVIAELRDEPALRLERLEVRADDGVVTLSGYVRTCAEKQAADRAARRVPGVKSLTSEIAIRRYATVQVPQAAPAATPRAATARAENAGPGPDLASP